LNEVDAALLAMPGVQDACAYLHGKDILAAALTPVPGAALDVAALYAGLSTMLPSYMIPTDLRVTDALATTSIGKRHRAGVAAAAHTYVPLPLHRNRPTASLVDNVERRLAAIWESLLGTTVADRFADFHLLGGNSLKVMQLLDRIEKQMGVHLTMTDIAARSLLIEQALLITERRRSIVGADSMFTPFGVSGIARSAESAVTAFLFAMTSEPLYASKQLATALSATMPVYGAAAYRFGRNETADGTIVERAQRCADEIRALAPQGGALLIGICGGSVIAQETARLLAADGERKLHLVLLDPSRLPARRRPRHEQDIRDYIAELGTMLRYRQFGSLRTRLIGSPLRSIRNRLGGAAAAADIEFRQVSEASWRHRPQPYEGDVLHVMSDDFARNPNVRRRWLELCPAGLAPIVLPRSTHRDIVIGRRSAEIAAAIDAFLHRGHG
jgi:acyl carrier protein